MNRLATVMKNIVRVEKVLVGIALAFAVLVIMVSVIGRRIGYAPSWTEEAVRYSVIWITFLASGICFRRQIHYGVDVIRRVGNEKFQKFILAFVLIASAVFAFALLYFGGRYVMFTMGTGQMLPASGIPYWIIYCAVPLGGFLIIVALIEVFMDSVLGVYKIEE